MQWTQERLTKLENAIQLLYLNRLITDSDLNKIRTKLVKQFANGVSK